MIYTLFRSSFLHSSGRSFAFFIKCGPVSFIHIDNKMIGEFCSREFRRSKSFVGWGDSILYGGCLASCCLGVFIVGGGFVSVPKFY